MDGLRQVWQSIGKRVGAMSVNQRLVLGMVATAVVISVTVFGLWLGRVEQAVLFSDLSPEDANAAERERIEKLMDVAVDIIPLGFNKLTGGFTERDE